MAEIGYDDVRMIATPSAEAKACRVLGVAVVLLYGVAIAVILGAVVGCVTAPNSNLAITIDLLSSHSRYGQALGGTNTQLRGEFAGGGALTATVPMSP
jgi:hypothetical protein